MEEELNLKVDENEFRLLKSLSNDDGQVTQVREGFKKVQNVIFFGEGGSLGVGRKLRGVNFICTSYPAPQL